MTFGVLAEVAIWFVSYFSHDTLEGMFRLSAVLSGRLSAIIFLIAFYLFATSQQAELKDNKPARQFINLFALVHIIHFGFLAGNVYLNSVELEIPRIAGGALAYLMIVAAPLYLHNLGRKFQLVYFYYVSFVMIMTYINRAQGEFQGSEPSWFHYVMIAVFLACCAVFGWQLRRKWTHS